MQNEAGADQAESPPQAAPVGPTPPGARWMGGRLVPLAYPSGPQGEIGHRSRMHASRRREIGCHRGKLRLRDHRRSWPRVVSLFGNAVSRPRVFEIRWLFSANMNDGSVSVFCFTRLRVPVSELGPPGACAPSHSPLSQSGRRDRAINMMHVRRLGPMEAD